MNPRPVITQTKAPRTVFVGGDNGRRRIDVFRQVKDRSLEQINAVMQQAKSAVASTAQKAANAAGLVAMIDVEVHPIARVGVAATHRASHQLGREHRVIILWRYSVVFSQMVLSVPARGISSAALRIGTFSAVRATTFRAMLLRIKFCKKLNLAALAARATIGDLQSWSAHPFMVTKGM